MKSATLAQRIDNKARVNEISDFSDQTQQVTKLSPEDHIPYSNHTQIICYISI